MNVIGKEKGANPRGRLVRTRQVLNRIHCSLTQKGSEKTQTPKSLVASLNPFALVKSAVIEAVVLILRITEDEQVRITEDGQERAIE